MQVVVVEVDDFPMLLGLVKAFERERCEDECVDGDDDFHYLVFY